MMRSTITALLSTMLIVFNSISFSQQTKKNELLNRAFWSKKPTLEMVKQKVEEGNDPEESDANLFDAVTLAINTDAPNDVLFYLLDMKGNHANKLTHDLRTYMFWVVAKGNLEVMEFLYKNKTNMKHIDEKGYSLLVFAAAQGQTDTRVYDFLISKGANIKTEKSPTGANALLLVSPSLKSIKDTEFFTKKGLSLKDVDEDGANIFTYAARGGNKDFLNDLIKAGVNHKAESAKGGNAFMVATQSSRTSENTLEFYVYLESLGLNPNTITKSGSTPLHNVARSKKMEVIKYFMDKGCDVNQANKEGNTPLMLAAAQQQDPEIFSMMFANAKDVNLKNNEGQTILTHAVMSNNAKICELIIGGSGNANVLDNEGNSLSYYLVKNFRKMEDYRSKLKVLYTFGFKHNLLQGNKNSLYHIAVLNKKFDLIKELSSDPSIDINAINGDGMTALHIAATMDDYGKFLKLLIELGADKTIKTEFDETAYDLASENELLQLNKVDVNFLK